MGLTVLLKDNYRRTEFLVGIWYLLHRAVQYQRKSWWRLEGTVQLSKRTPKIMHSYRLWDLPLSQCQTQFTIYSFSCLFNTHVRFWNKGVLIFTDYLSPWVILIHFIIPVPPGQFLFEWQYMGTWSNCWILMRLYLFVLKFCFCGCVLFLVFVLLSLMMKVLNSWPLLHSTAEWLYDSTEKSKANFVACIDNYANLTSSTPLTHGIQCMQTFWEKIFTKSHASL